MKFTNKHVLLSGATAIFLLISASIFAQSNKWAVQAGAGFSYTHNYSSTNYYTTKFGFSWAASGVWEHAFKNPKFGLMLEPGVSFDSYIFPKSPLLEKDVVIKLSHVNLPVLAYFKPTRTDLLKVVLGLAPSFRFSESGGFLDMNFIDNYHETFSLSYVIGVQIKATNRLAFGARAMQSLTPILSINVTNDIGDEIPIQDVYFGSLRAYVRYYLK